MSHTQKMCRIIKPKGIQTLIKGNIMIDNVLKEDKQPESMIEPLESYVDE